MSGVFKENLTFPKKQKKFNEKGQNSQDLQKFLYRKFLRLKYHIHKRYFALVKYSIVT